MDPLHPSLAGRASDAVLSATGPPYGPRAIGRLIAASSFPEAYASACASRASSMLGRSNTHLHSGRTGHPLIQIVHISLALGSPRTTCRTRRCPRTPCAYASGSAAKQLYARGRRRCGVVTSNQRGPSAWHTARLCTRLRQVDRICARKSPPWEGDLPQCTRSSSTACGSPL